MPYRSAGYVIMPDAQKMLPMEDIQEQLVQKVVDKLYERNINASAGIFINRFIVIYEGRKEHVYACGFEEKGFDKVVFLTKKDIDKFPDFVKMLNEFDIENPGISAEIDEIWNK